MSFRAEGKMLVVRIVEDAEDLLTPEEHANVLKEQFVDDKEGRGALRKFGFTRLKLEAGGQTFIWELR